MNVADIRGHAWVTGKKMDRSTVREQCTAVASVAASHNLRALAQKSVSVRATADDIVTETSHGRAVSNQKVSGLLLGAPTANLVFDMLGSPE